MEDNLARSEMPTSKPEVVGLTLGTLGFRTIDEVCALLGFKQSKAYALMASGDLQYIGVCRGSRLIADQEIIRFLNSRARGKRSSVPVRPYKRRRH